MRLTSGKTAVITGGSSGIGFAIAEELLKKGLCVVLVARRAAVLEEAKKKLGTENVEIVSADVSSAGSLKEAKKRIMARRDNIDLLVNCAGIVKPALLSDLSVSDISDQISTNLLGMVLAVRTFIDCLAKDGGIISISSVNGIFGIAGYAPYAASKFGVVGFSDAVRRELFKKGISIHVVFPPDTDTPQYRKECEHMPEWMNGWVRSNPLPPEVVAKRIIKAASRGRFMIFPSMTTKFYAFMARHLPLLSRFLIDRIAPKP
ncbi:MAG: SDR family NAD(P)-dependent oxidoreductase [Spirochaetes bacterium]|nr:SDR family NAD(P)-dependent oxidoreductase [Spirochaetota bacterium]